MLHFLTASDQTAWKAGKRLSEQLPPVTGTIVVQGSGEQPNAAAILKKTATFMEWLAKKISGWHDAGEGLSTSFHGLAASFDKMAVALMQFSGPQSGQPEYESHHYCAAMFSLSENNVAIGGTGARMSHRVVLMTCHTFGARNSMLFFCDFIIATIC